MHSRLLALLLLLAVLPTAEVCEQLVHAIGHAVGHATGDDDGGEHVAHHADLGDEHGCTSLIHLCGHQAQVTSQAIAILASGIETLDTTAVLEPAGLHDLTSLEPPHRPPIG